MLLGFGEGYRRFVIDTGEVGKHISEPDGQRNLDLLLQRNWRNKFGRELEIRLAAIDANYTTDDVLGFCQHHSPSRVIAVRGIGGDSTPRLARVPRERSKGGVVLKFSRRFFNVGTYPLKASLYRDLAKDDPVRRVTFPSPMTCRLVL